MERGSALLGIGGWEFWILALICVGLLGPLAIAAIVLGIGKKCRCALGPAAWLPDPSGRHELRYWSGLSWTDNVRDGEQQSADRWTRADRRRPI